jgi:hypothetical protein
MRSMNRILIALATATISIWISAGWHGAVINDEGVVLLREDEIPADVPYYLLGTSAAVFAVARALHNKMTDCSGASSASDALLVAA